jgi:hypothetical protein
VRHVYYVQPDNDGRPVACFLTEAEAIARAKAVHSYATDEAALADFMAVHWASFEPEDFMPEDFIAPLLDGGAA